jgi:hypothetical protein
MDKENGGKAHLPFVVRWIIYVKLFLVIGGNLKGDILMLFNFHRFSS